jgi:6-phosphogluconolactonase
LGGARVGREVRVYPGLASASSALARHVAGQAREAVRARGAFSLVLAGGETPRNLYRLLARRYRRSFPWYATDVYFGDERCVSLRDPQSNYAMAREALLSRVPIPPHRVHRIRGELRPPSVAAAIYARLLGPAAVRTGRRPPRFDLVLLGIGRDAHTASLFPGSPVLAERRRPVASVRRAGQPPYVPRITLTLPALASSREVCFLVAGAEKAAAVAAVLRSGPRGTPRLPASRVRSTGPTVWFLDRGAASALPPRPGSRSP